MSKRLKIMLFWSLLFPIIITAFRIIIDSVFLNKTIELLSYGGAFLGIAAGGLLFAGPITYLIFKNMEEGGKEQYNSPVHFNLLRRLQRFNTLKDVNKVDKGVAINYYKLSYRRKMIRTVFILPLLILFYICIDYFLNYDMAVNFAIASVLLFLLAVQFIYNFIKWRKYERW